jgi:hypothetical protein
MNDETKEPAAQPAKEPPPYTAMAGATVQQSVRTPGLTQAPGLRELPDSKVPGLAGGGEVSHVFGPGQTPVDPIAAGLDLGYNPLTRSEDRLITQTGTIGAGARPSTYLDKGGKPIPQAGPSDHANVPAPSDAVAADSPGPNSTGGPAPEDHEPAA